MTDWTKTKAGDEVEVPGWGKIKLTGPVRRSHLPGYLTAPGCRWIKSKQKFSGFHYFLLPNQSSSSLTRIRYNFHLFTPQRSTDRPQTSVKLPPGS